MKKRLLLATAAVVILVLIVTLYNRMSDQRRVLEGSDRFILYSLLPYMESFSFKSTEKFHGEPVLGKVEVNDPKLKRRIIAALYDGMAHSSPREYATCFNPRHGIRAIKGGRTVDVVVCFECRQLDFWENGKGKHGPINRSPRELFNRVLADAKVPLSKNPYEE